MTTAGTRPELSRILADRARRRARRRRVLAAVLIVAALPVGYVAWRAGRHTIAATYLAARGYLVVWNVDREGWRQAGTTAAEYAPHVLGFVGSERSPGETGFLTWLHRVGRLDLSRLDGLRDEELSCLAALPGLTALNLDQRDGNQWFARRSNRPTDAFLPAIRGLVRLRDLNLAGTRITDAGLVHLAGLADLRLLDLCDTEVSDAGLGSLRGLKRLGYVGLRGTRVTAEGAARLKAALPEADVDHESIPTAR